MGQRAKSADTATRKVSKEAKGARKDAEKNLESITAVMSAPKDLGGIALAEWKRIVKLNNKMEKPLLNDMDSALLKGYCFAVQVYDEALQAINQVQNPLDRMKLASAVNKRAEEVSKLARSLGITLLERTRFASTQPKTTPPKDPLQDLIDS